MTQTFFKRIQRKHKYYKSENLLIIKKSSDIWIDLCIQYLLKPTYIKITNSSSAQPCSHVKTSNIFMAVFSCVSSAYFDQPLISRNGKRACAIDGCLVPFLATIQRWCSKDGASMLSDKTQLCQYWFDGEQDVLWQYTTSSRASPIKLRNQGLTLAVLGQVRAQRPLVVLILVH